MANGNYNTVGEALQFYKDRCGEDTPFYVFRDKDGGRQVFTFKTLHRLAGRCAALFKSKGIKKGSKVVVCLVNSPERLVCEFGLLYAGAVVINGVCQIPDGSDLFHGLRHSQASVILLDPDVIHTPWTLLQKVAQRADDGTVTSEKLLDLKRVEFVRRRPGKDFLTQLESSSEWFMEEGVQSSDDCFAFTTSGTTGLPKMAVHPHGTFVTAMQQYPPNAGTPERHVRYQETPMGTSGGNVTCTLMLNETRVLCDVRAGKPEDKAAFITRCIREENCTKAVLVCADIITINQRVKLGRGAAGEAEPADNHHNGLALSWDTKLSQISIGGQPVTRTAVDAALDLAGSVLVYYGTSELGLISATLTTEKGRYEDYCVGRLVPGVRVKVIDDDTEKEVSVGKIGQILINHPFPFTEYLHDPSDSTAPRKADTITHDGFYRTGDRGKVGADSALTVFGRMGDSVIMKNTVAFYPHAIEANLLACAGIRDVIIVGVPDPELIEEFCACVVLEEGVSLKAVEVEVEKTFAGPDVPYTCHRPRYYLKFESLPRLYTGRHDRRQIKEIARKQLMSESLE